MSTLIIGCGNPDRGDDAAGLLAARRLREMGCDASEHTGDMLSLLDIWAGYDEVIVIDAMVAGGGSGETSSHAFGLAEVIDLARTLGRLPRQFTVYGIEALNCDIGAPLSQEVAAEAEKLARALATAISERSAPQSR